MTISFAGRVQCIVQFVDQNLYKYLTVLNIQNQIATYNWIKQVDYQILVNKSLCFSFFITTARKISLIKVCIFFLIKRYKSVWKNKQILIRRAKLKRIISLKYVLFN